VAQILPVLVSLFNTRLDLLVQALNTPARATSNELIDVLRAMVRQIPTDSFLVQRVYAQIKDAWTDEFWQYLTPDRIALLQGKVGPLLRFARADDVPGATFTHKVERLKLALARGQAADTIVTSIREDVARLPQFVTQDPEQGRQVQFCLSARLEAATPAELNQVIVGLAPQMRHKRERYDNLLVLNLKDIVDQRGYIILTGRNEKVYVDEYRSRVETRVLQMVIGHPTVTAIEQGRPVSDAQLLDLERTLRRELGRDDLELTESNIRKAYAVQVDSLLAFLRFLLELPGLPDYCEIVERQFGEYLAAHPFTADQVLFLRTVKSRMISRRRLELLDLYAPPFTGFGTDALARLFTQDQQSELLALAGRLAIA
jgi:type I restriction enzyme R subunit